MIQEAYSTPNRQDPVPKMSPYHIIVKTQKLQKEMKALIDVANQIVQTDIWEHFMNTQKIYTFFIAYHGTFFKINHILDHKAPQRKVLYGICNFKLIQTNHFN